MLNNTIYLRRRSKVALPSLSQSGSVELLPINVVATASVNLETLGYILSDELLQACRKLSQDEFSAFYRNLADTLKRLKGAHQAFKPMYPNFPEQVMGMDETELYLNALIHYWTAGQVVPFVEVKKRASLPLMPATTLKLQVIGLGTGEEFRQLFTKLVGSNASLSEQDKEDVAWFVKAYGQDIERLLPEVIPQKETIATLAALLFKHALPSRALEIIGKFIKTATDVLRLAVSMSGGDISLAQPRKFISFKRAERKLLLSLLERFKSPVEDMLRWKGRWIRLGERLHPGEFGARFPKSAEAFRILRDDIPVETFNRLVEHALAAHDPGAALMQLKARPGDMARRLDHLLRLTADNAAQAEILNTFEQAAPNVSTPLLLQVMHHFQRREAQAGKLRVFLPKGDAAKAHAEPNTLPDLPHEITSWAYGICAAVLQKRFAALPPLGKCYVDPTLTNFLVPFSQRSASKSLRTTSRGSKLPLPECEVLRFFVWWKNGKDRTDLDLSAAVFDQEFNYVDQIAYYNLKSYGGVHSGDIVDAPEGASEFIDITLSKVREQKVRYVVMVVMSYTNQHYCDLPECFAGWMARSAAQSGEIYEPRTVQDKLDLSANMRIALPVVFDLIENEAIWCDLTLKGNPRWVNNVAGNSGGIQLSLRTMLDLNKPNLYSLLTMHAIARGEMVGSAEEAETVFSVERDTPFHLDVIASEFMQ